MAGIIERAQSAARSALLDTRSAQAPATFDSRPDLFAQLQSSLRGLVLDAGPAQQDAGQPGVQSAIAAPAGLQSLPSDALQYVMSGMLGRWFRQHSPAENKNMLHRLRQQDSEHAEDPGTLFCSGPNMTFGLLTLHGLSCSFCWRMYVCCASWCPVDIILRSICKALTACSGVVDRMKQYL